MRRAATARRGPLVSGGLALVLSLAACTMPPKESQTAHPEADASGPSGPPPLRPLARQGSTPADAPRSRVAPVRYDLGVGAEGDLPEDGVSGGGPPVAVFQRGGASWYGLQFHQRKTANGERFDMGAFTAAHRTLPFGTQVCVRSLVNGREVLVRINDRGPYAAGRIIDLSQAAAAALNMIGLGIKQVALSLIGPDGGRCNGMAVRPGGDVAAPVAAGVSRRVAKARPAKASPRRR